jgi:hypothetical protein
MKVAGLVGNTVSSLTVACWIVLIREIANPIFIRVHPFRRIVGKNIIGVSDAITI